MLGVKAKWAEGFENRTFQHVSAVQGKPIGGVGKPIGGVGKPMCGVGKLIGGVGKSIGGVGKSIGGVGKPADTLKHAEGLKNQTLQPDLR